MKQDQFSMEEILAKAADTRRLPTYEEAFQLLTHALAMKTDIAFLLGISQVEIFILV